MHRGIPVFLYLSKNATPKVKTESTALGIGPPHAHDVLSSPSADQCLIMDIMSDSLRLETVEIKLAHLERSLQELGQTVVHQQREIATIMARHRELQRQLEALEGNEAQ